MGGVGAKDGVLIFLSDLVFSLLCHRSFLTYALQVHTIHDPNCVIPTFFFHTHRMKSQCRFMLDHEEQDILPLSLEGMETS